MPEESSTKSWRNRLSQQINGFHLSTCISPNIVRDDEEEERNNTKPSPPPTVSATLTKRRLLWRKPLPNDCPIFDFTNTTTKVMSLEEKTEIPTRYQSKYYKEIPNMEAELDRACKNEKAILLTSVLSQQQRH